VDFLLHRDRNLNILHNGHAGGLIGLRAQPPSRRGACKSLITRIHARRAICIASKNYGSWSLRGWLLCKMSGLDFEEQQVSADDPSTRAELLLLSPSFLVPCLTHDGLKIWDTLAIAEYLHEINPGAGLFPSDRAQRAHCRSICGEMHSGFSNLRSALPMNIKARFVGFKAWAGARADIDRITSIWREWGFEDIFGKGRGCRVEHDGNPRNARYCLLE
jgi:Glutathione S-transferase, N-terminal domain